MEAPAQEITTLARPVLGLSFTAGYIDALGFVDLHGVYTGAMTGNTVQLGITVAHADFSQLGLIAATLGSFFAGAILASFVKRRLPRSQLLLLVVMGLLGIAQALRLINGGPLLLELPLLAMAMAMQGQTISRFGATAMQTVVMTSNLLKFADALVGRFFDGTARRGASGARTPLAEVILPGCGWIGYTIGAASGVLAAATLATPFLPPIIILAVVCGDLLWHDRPATPQS